MKLNTKDLLSGAVLIGVALVGLWLNLDHTLGSARRMGPGYMPMLSFWLLFGIGVAVVGIGLFSGPDPVPMWTMPEIASLIGGVVVGYLAGTFAASMDGWAGQGWNPLGIGLFVGCMIVGIVKSWRPLFLITAAFCLFGLVLETFGLMASIAVSVALSAFADDTHKPVGVVGLVVFLCVLCWGVFIWELDIRVPVWPVF